MNQKDLPGAMAIMLMIDARHAKLKNRLEKLGERSDANAAQFDSLTAAENELHNLIETIYQSRHFKPLHALVSSGLDPQAAMAMQSIGENERVSYRDESENAQGYKGLIDSGLAYDISTQFSGEIMGLRLAPGGVMLKRMAEANAQ